MNKKTNNIIAIVIIIVLTICLAFTIVDNNETKTEVVNFDMPDTSRRGKVLYQGNRFNLPKDNLGTPLICMGDHYIMGWADTDRVKFDSYVQKFK